MADIKTTEEQFGALLTGNDVLVINADSGDITGVRYDLN
jgi:hypothetical protein